MSFLSLIILDDISDAPEVSRHEKLLHQLYVRGRHSFISVVTSVQKIVTFGSHHKGQCYKHLHLQAQEHAGPKRLSR